MERQDQDLLPVQLVLLRLEYSFLKINFLRKLICFIASIANSRWNLIHTGNEFVDFRSAGDRNERPL